MKAPSSEALIRSLSRDLEPVRPIPRLRVAFGGVVGLWALGLVVAWLLGMPLPQVGRGGRWADPAFLAVLVGLGMTGVGALLRGLSGAVPGRAETARRSGQLAVLGLALAASGAGYALVAAASLAGSADAMMHLTCTGRAAALGVVPAGFACAFLARAAPAGALLAAGSASLGALALAATSIHASCQAESSVHWLLGHSLGPLAVAVLISFPLAAAVSRLARRGAEDPPG